MAASFPDIASAFASFGQPLNVAILAGSGIAGLLLAGLARRAGLNGTVAMVLALPGAAVLEPGMGMMLMGALAAAGMASHRVGALALIAAAAGAAVLLLGGLAAAQVGQFSNADQALVLVAAAGLAVIVASIAQPGSWAVALAMTVFGVGLSFAPWKPLDAETGGVVPPLLGLMVIGPCLVALLRPTLRDDETLEHSGGVALTSTVVPAWLIGVPLTLGGAALQLNLGDYGLRMGPLITLQRTKLVLGFALAMLVTLVLLWVLRHGATRIRVHLPSLKLTSPVFSRAAALVGLMLGIAAYYQSGLDQYGEFRTFDTLAIVVLVVSTLLGALATWWGLDAAPLVVGAVIGQMLAPALSGGSPVQALAAGSLPLLALAIVSVGAALVWPLLVRLTGLSPKPLPERAPV